MTFYLEYSSVFFVLSSEIKINRHMDITAVVNYPAGQFLFE